MSRRKLLKLVAALAAIGIAPGAVRSAQSGDANMPNRHFDYAALKGRARALAAAPHRPTARPLPAAVKALDWDAYQSIRYRPERALWAGEGRPFTARFFHLGLFFDDPVRLHELVAGKTREIAYDASAFDDRRSGLAESGLPGDLGFAGFRLLGRDDPERDIVAFLGASYFRAVGAEKQHGLSARGLAVDTAMNRPEEFPRFTDFWLEAPARSSDRLRIFALLDSPSVTGAYRFTIVPGRTLIMEVDAALYPRQEIERIGIAPLTSMYQHGENDKRMANDWRPEIHDSDGLALCPVDRQRRAAVAPPAQPRASSVQRAHGSGPARIRPDAA